MKNLEILSPRKVKVSFTGNQWQLYTSAMPEEAEIVAGILNKELERCINEGYSKSKTLSFMHTQMRYFDETGANDSEPHYFLESVLDAVFQ